MDNMESLMQRSVLRLQLKAKKEKGSFFPDKDTTDRFFSVLPGAGFLDLKVRMTCGWEPGSKSEKGQYIISYQGRKITGPDGRKAKFDRAPFQLFLALLQKHGHLLERHAGTAIVERITRQVHGPILLQQLDLQPGFRSESPITYPEMNRIVAKLKKQLKKIGLDHAFQTVRAKGWQFVISGNDFIFMDMPAYLPDAKNLAFLSIDINKREIHYLDKSCRLGPLPFNLFQLLMRYSGVPISSRLISSELGLMRDASHGLGYQYVQDRLRQHFLNLRKALSTIKAPVRIVSEYGIGWHLSVKK
jgi:DNA-binding winged helix-turn-helix (wHTH) protein